MIYHSQNNEAHTVINYFSGRIGNLLDVGANDGITLSNSYDLIKLGWRATLIEPVKKSYNVAAKLHKSNNLVSVLNVGIGQSSVATTIFESANHIKGGKDYGLVSTIVRKEKEKWSEVFFVESEIQLKTFSDLNLKDSYQFISIDCEGMDLEVLMQINLTDVGCECICVEHNSDTNVLNEIVKYCSGFGLNKQLLFNAENVILAI